MTWAEFKAAVEASGGITDETPIHFIDVHPMSDASGVAVKIDAEHGATIVDD